MKTLLPLLSLIALSACSGSDPTPAREDAASAEAINATVEKAENGAEAAKERAEAAE